MDIRSSIKLAHKQSLIQYFTLENEPIDKRLYLKSNHRYIELELGIKDFPVNGIVLDFSYIKLLIKDIIAVVQGKIVLCSKSKMYSINQVGENLVVQTINGQIFCFSERDSIILGYHKLSEERMCYTFSRYIQENLSISAYMETLLIFKVYLSKLKGKKKVKVAVIDMAV